MKFTSAEHFITEMIPQFEEALLRNNLDPMYAPALVAQAALESGWGKYVSGKYNYSGIKLPKSKQGKGLGTIVKTWEVINGQKIVIYDEFRDFNDLMDYADYKIKFLMKPRYSSYNGLTARDFYQKTKDGGYATDPDYVKKLMQMYDSVMTRINKLGIKPLTSFIPRG